MGYLVIMKSWVIMSRSNRPEVFCKRGAITNFAKFTRKHLTQSLFFNKIASLKQSSDTLVIVAKGFLKLPNLHMLIKQKSPLLSRSLALVTFGELPIVFSRKVNLLYLLYSTGQSCCLVHLIKQNCLLQTFIETLVLMTEVSLYLLFFLELI